MKNTIALLLAAFWSVPVFAQEMQPVQVYKTELYCYRIEDAMNTSIAFGEKPLFVGIATVDGLNDENEPTLMQGPMLFLVNQDTGTWANYIFSPVGTVCTLAIGGAFEPYTE